MKEFLHRLLNLAKPYRLLLVLGCCCSVFLSGLVDPLLVLVIPLVGLVVYGGTGADSAETVLKNLSPRLQTVADAVAAWFTATGNFARHRGEDFGDPAGAVHVHLARLVQLPERVLPPVGRRPRHHRPAHPFVRPSPKSLGWFFCPVGTPAI